MAGILKKQCSLRESNSVQSNISSLEVAEVLFENLSLDSDDDKSVQGEQTPDQESGTSADCDQVNQSSTPKQLPGLSKDGEQVTTYERSSRPIDWQSAMQSLTMTAVHLLNLEKDIFDMARDVATFVGSASSLEAMTFEIRMGPLQPSNSMNPDAVAHLTIDEILQLVIYIPHMRLLSQIILLKEKLAESAWSGWGEHHDYDDECAVIDDEEEEDKERLVYSIALISTKAGRLEDLISIILPKWRSMMVDTINFGKDSHRAAILDQFVDSILRWATDYAVRSEALPCDLDI